MAKTTEPRKMEGTAETNELTCDFCHKPIPMDENHLVRASLGKPDQHYHVGCAAQAEVAGATDRSKEKPVSEPDNGLKQLPEIVGYGLARMMRDRAVHREIELEMDVWFRALPATRKERLAVLSEARDQMETGRLAIDALYSRFRTMASTAKN